jgi:hypothetical protein
MIVGLSGYAQSGKDTVGAFLAMHHGFTRMAFADQLRNALLALNPLVTANIRVADVVDAGWEPAKARYPEVRNLLQRLGTEVGRNLFGDFFWVDQLLQRVYEYPNVVITDVRFPNEANAIQSLGGYVWRINRPDRPPINSHVSETALDDWGKFDAEIGNSGTFADLEKKVNQILRARLENR